MISSTPTVTLHIPVSQMPVVLARLTAFLLQARYAFLQTCHSAGHIDVEVFDQYQQLLVRCTLRVTDTAAPVPTLPESPAPGVLAADLMSLLDELVQLCTATSENRP